MEKSGDKRVRVGDPELTPFPGRISLPQPRAWASGPGREKRTQRLQVQSPELKSGARVRALPAPGRSPNFPRAMRHLAAGALRRPRPLQATRAHPAAGGRSPRMTPGARGAATVLEPRGAALSLPPERPFDMSASRNLSPRAGSCAPQVLSSRSSFPEKQQKFEARLPWLESTTFFAYLNVFPPTENEDQRARPPPNFNSLNPDKKP